jgi:Ca-activated chloride channel family protein
VSEVALPASAFGAAAALIVCLKAGAPYGQQAPPFRTGVDLVGLSVSVADKRGRPVSDLAADDFQVFEGGRRQTIQYFGSALSPSPDMHLGLLLDVSESMGEDLGFTRTAAVRFLNTLTEAADVTIVDFDTEVRAARYEQREFARVIERIRGSKARGQTALFDAIGVYLDGAAAQEGRKVMLLYTDGGDTRSAISFRDIMELVKASDVTIYTVGMLDHQSTSSRAQQQMVLRQLAETSGGRAVFPASVKELDKIYEQLAAEIRAGYTIGYVSTNDKADGTWRKVEIRLLRPDARDLRVRSRPGYFAPYRR